MSEQLGRARCIHCDGEIEFDVANFEHDTVVDCPHCKKPTVLRLNRKAGITIKLLAAVTSFRKSLSYRQHVLLISIAIWATVVGGSYISAGFGHVMWALFILIAYLSVVILVIFLYLLPAYVGRKKRNFNAIFVLNLLLGWTVLGWVIALVWACTVDSEK